MRGGSGRPIPHGVEDRARGALQLSGNEQCGRIRGSTSRDKAGPGLVVNKGTLLHRLLIGGQPGPGGLRIQGRFHDGLRRWSMNDPGTTRRLGADLGRPGGQCRSRRPRKIRGNPPKTVESIRPRTIGTNTNRNMNTIWMNTNSNEHNVQT